MLRDTYIASIVKNRF